MIVTSLKIYVHEIKLRSADNLTIFFGLEVKTCFSDFLLKFRTFMKSNIAYALQLTNAVLMSYLPCFGPSVSERR